MNFIQIIFSCDISHGPCNRGRGGGGGGGFGLERGRAGVSGGCHG